MKKVLLIFSLFIGSLTSNAQVTIDPINAADIANFLQGSGITISNLVINCDSTAYGSMTSGVSSFHASSGLILSTGNVANIANSASAFASTFFALPGDPDIAVNTVFTSYDACALEFDAVPAFGNIYFEYVWGSEEYPEFVCSFNDMFLLLISGPGISGPYSNNSTNIALLPDSVTIVSINTVHANAPNNTCPTPFDSLYIDNTGDTTIVFDGFTQMLTAAIDLQAGETYHFKILVADVMDGIFDSGVFLMENSFRSMAPVSVAEKRELNFTIFPNPSADGQFTILSETAFNPNDFLKVYDISGREIKCSKTYHGQTLYLNLNQAEAGVYFLNLNNRIEKLVIR
jgi:hypothetical protein